MKNLLVAAILGGLVYGCSQDSPTTPLSPATPKIASATSPSSDAVDTAIVEDHTDQLRAFFREMSQMGSGSQLPNQVDDFTCNDVEEVRVRFSDPGFVNNLNVGLFIKLIGIPAGTKNLRIWWDYDDAFNEHQDIVIGDGDLNPEDSSRFDVETVIEHSYASAGRKKVRVELILRGSSGNCARNRDIIVAPGTSATGPNFDHIITFAGVPNCVAFFGSRSMGLRANFNPPIPAGTTYSVTFRVNGGGVFPPSMTIAMAGNTAGPDTVNPPPLMAAPPNDFTVALNSTVQHAQLQIATQIFSLIGITPTSMTTSILAIDVPGKSVLIVDNLNGSCP